MQSIFGQLLLFVTVREIERRILCILVIFLWGRGSFLTIISNPVGQNRLTLGFCEGLYPTLYVAVGTNFIGLCQLSEFA